MPDGYGDDGDGGAKGVDEIGGKWNLLVLVILVVVAVVMEVLVIARRCSNAGGIFDGDIVLMVLVLFALVIVLIVWVLLLCGEEGR